MVETTTHRGGCHCGNVRYEVRLDLGKPVIVCNCSICSKSGSMLAFVPASDFKLLQGEESLKDYRFNRRVIAHAFCTNCGIKSFARGVGPDGHEMAAINARCLDDVHIDELKTIPYDGRSA